MRNAPGSARASSKVDAMCRPPPGHRMRRRFQEYAHRSIGETPDKHSHDDSADYPQDKSPGCARVPMPPADTPPAHIIQESQGYAQRCVGTTHEGDSDGDAVEYHHANSRSRSRTRIAPGSARVRFQAFSQAERQAFARAQRKAGDSHRLWLDRKYKKRAWKRQAQDPEAENSEHGYPDDLNERDWHDLIARAPSYPGSRRK